MSRSVLPRRAWLWALALPLAPLASPAIADGDIRSDTDAPLRLDAVVVTARQAEEAPKDAPLSLSVLTSATLEEQRLDTVSRALSSLSSLQHYNTGDPLYDNFIIRGVGTIGNVSMDNDAVAVNINGSAAPNRSFGLATLDVERIEVLKGPQGTLMGRNSSAGAINIVTHRPAGHFEAYVKGALGNDDFRSGELMLNTPLSERVRARLAVRHSGEEHWVDNSNTGKPVADPRQLAARASLAWDLSDATSALISVERHKQDGLFSLMLLRPYGDPLQTDVTPGIYDDNSKKLTRYSLELKHRFAASELTAVTSVDRDRYDAVSVNDRTLMRNAYGVDMEEILPLRVASNVVTQDIRLSSLPDAKVFWVAGINYWRSRRDFDSEYPSQNSRQDKRYETISHALYAEATYPVAERFKLTTGLRYTRDRKRFDATYYMPDPVPDARRLDDHYTTGRVALSYALTDDANLYAALSRGYRPGGVGDYAAQPDDSEPYRASKTNHAEIGLKYQSPDHRYTLNAAVFLADMKQEQVSTYDAATYFIRYRNLDARSYGVEIEGDARLSPTLRLAGGVTYTHARARQALVGLSEGDVANGNRLPGSPEWKATLALQYAKPLPDFLHLAAPTLNASLSLQYVGSQASDIQNNFKLKPYSVVDARVGVQGRQSELYVYANNLFDKQYELYRYSLGGDMALGGRHRGRSIGIGYNYYF